MTKKKETAKLSRPDNNTESELDKVFGTSLREKAKKKRITDRLYGVDLREQFFPTQNLDAGTQFDDRRFKNLRQAGSTDLPPETTHLGQLTSMLQYRKNVRAFRVIDLTAKMAVGGGVSFEAEDDDVQELLEDHWELNEWDDKLDERIKGLAIFGEQMYVAQMQKRSILALTGISAFKIRQILRDPKNAEIHEFAEVDLTSSGAFTQSEDKDFIKFPLIRRDWDTGLWTHSKGKQDPAFFFAENRVSGGSRGVPDLLAAIDWLEGFDGFSWALMERANTAGNVVHDLKYTGAGPDDVERMTRNFKRNLHSGGVFGHNENVEYEPRVPNFGASDADQIAKTLMRQIHAGTGFAGLFFGDSDDLTRAAASELSIPVAKTFQSRQNFFKRMLKKIFSYQIQVAIDGGRLKADVKKRFTIQMPKIFLRDMTTVTAALGQLSQGLSDAVTFEWMTNEEAARTFRSSVEELGNILDDSVILPTPPADDDDAFEPPPEGSNVDDAEPK